MSILSYEYTHGPSWHSLKYANAISVVQLRSGFFSLSKVCIRVATSVLYCLISL